jgi:RNA polymerase sigma-70 factor (ECF subfamily)
MTFRDQQEYIKSSLYRFTRDKWLIDELTQETNIKIHNSQKEEKSKGWIYSIIRSVYIDYYRKTNSKKSGVIVYKDHDGESKFRPDEMLIAKANRERLLKCIELLPEKQKEIVYLRYYSGLDYLQICDIMKCPKNTALSYMHKAKANLKLLLTKNQ